MAQAGVSRYRYARVYKLVAMDANGEELGGAEYMVSMAELRYARFDLAGEVELRARQRLDAELARHGIARVLAAHYYVGSWRDVFREVRE